MFSFLKRLLLFIIWGDDTSEERKRAQRRNPGRAIKRVDLENRSILVQPNAQRPLGLSEPPHIFVKQYDCFEKCGKITFICEEYGLIDDLVYFSPGQVSNTVFPRLNDEVFYTAFKDEKHNFERVFKIHGIRTDFWEGDESILLISDDDERQIMAIPKHVPGKVVKKRGRHIFIDSLNTWCNLNVTSTTFTPIEGDWLSVEIDVEFDEDAANFCGDVIYIRSIEPMIKKNSFGRISLTVMSGNRGAIEHSVYFSRTVRERGYIPDFGDHVVYNAIESDQEPCKWRALAVHPYNINAINEEEEDVEDDDVAVSSFSNKNGITITPRIGKVRVVLNDSVTISFDITNRGPQDRLLKYIFIPSSYCSQVALTEQPPCNTLIKSNTTTAACFTCHGMILGSNAEICIFRFENFIIARKIEINVFTVREMENLLKREMEAESSSSRNRSGINDENTDVVLYGPRPWHPPRFVSRERKGSFKVPQNLTNIVRLIGMSRSMALEEYAPYMEFDLNYEHYADRFHTFLHLEEAELRKRLEKYAVNKVTLAKSGCNLSLKIPNVVENRPAIVAGDTVILTQPWLDRGRIQHVGFIHSIEQDEVFLKFHCSFNSSYRQTMCRIKFVPNTFFFNRCHEAVRRAKKTLGENWLFPSVVEEKQAQMDFTFKDFVKNVKRITWSTSDSPLKNKAQNTSFRFLNENLNDQQKQAVVNILKGQGRPLPYIIFGPPGTGKTVTLVEVIIQIYRLIPESRILIATPSHSVADLICTRLIDAINLEPGQLIRLSSITRHKLGLIPPHLRAYTIYFNRWETRLCKFKSNQSLRWCNTFEVVGKHRIMVSTCSNFGRLHFCGYPSGHFTHILIHNAGQATEPEILIAATFLKKSSGQVVLAGDPQQLGPVVFSPLSKRYGFGKSLLERFMKVFPYTPDLTNFPNTFGYDPRFITRLNINYRSVPEILALPNQLFYNSSVISAVSQTEGEEADIIRKFNVKLGSREEPVAVLFHGIMGKNYREPTSPSWFNPKEVFAVMCYLKKLYSVGLKSTDVAVLTPYAKQMEKLATYISRVKLAVPKIATVEDFLGQEKKVVILSCVRSSITRLKTDSIYNLGFVGHPKRLNVALSRAKALLIILGNPVLLLEDPYWVSLIKYCIDNQNYTGCDPECFRDKLQMKIKEQKEKELEEEDDDDDDDYDDDDDDDYEYEDEYDDEDEDDEDDFDYENEFKRHAEGAKELAEEKEESDEEEEKLERKLELKLEEDEKLDDECEYECDEEEEEDEFGEEIEEEIEEEKAEEEEIEEEEDEYEEENEEEDEEENEEEDEEEEN